MTPVASFLPCFSLPLPGARRTMGVPRTPMPTPQLKRTPLYDVHRASGAKMVDFGGWDMPVQYSGLVNEHHTVRRAVGLFDVSHMGEIEIRGPEAAQLADAVTTNAVAKLACGTGLDPPGC